MTKNKSNKQTQWLVEDNSWPTPVQEGEGREERQEGRQKERQEGRLREAIYASLKR